MSSIFPRILFSVMCALSAANPVWAAESAEDAAGKVAMDFINAHVAEPVGYEETIARVEASPLVTARYKSALAKLYRDALKEEPDLGYGADAVIGGQDNPDRFRVKSCQVADARARVVLVGADPPDFPMEVKVDLVRENGRWLVDASGDLVKD
jgi:hypothetical protein